MKKALKLTLAVALMMGATSLYAQKFGRINSQEIVMAMPETKEMQPNLETFGKELNENIETINVEFNNKLQEYQKTANTLTDAVREMKAKELEDLQRRSQEFQQMAQRDYAKKQEELLQPIIEKAKAAIDKIAAAGGYLFVFDTSAGSLAYFDDGPRSRGAQGAGHYRRPCSRSGSPGRRFEIIPHAGRRIFPPGGGPHGRTLSGVRFFIGSKVVRNSSNCPKTVLFGPIYADYCYICRNVSEQ